MEKYSVLVSDKLSEEGLQVLKNHDAVVVQFKTGMSNDELKKHIKHAHALVVRSSTQVTKEILKEAQKLKVIGRAGIGTDNIDVAAARSAGIDVMNTPTGNTITTAEHAISLLFALARNIPQAAASMKAGKWEKSRFQGVEVTGKTLGLVGLGNIGKEVAKRAHGLQMNVVAFDPMLTSEAMLKVHAHKVELNELFQSADFISIHAPLNEHTKHLLNSKAFKKMKDGVRLVHAARGGIVDEEALLDALNSGKVAAAALDVFETEPPQVGNALVAHEKVIATPHLGASTEEAQIRVGVQIARQTLDYLIKGKSINLVG